MYYKHWNAEEEAIMKNFYSTEHSAIINRLPQRNVAQIYSKARSMGLQKKQVLYPFDEDLYVLEKLLDNGEVTYKLANEIRKELISLGYPPRSVNSYHRRLQNYNFLVNGCGLSNYSSQSQRIYAKMYKQYACDNN